MHIALIPPLIEVDIPAREEIAETYVYQVFQAKKNRGNFCTPLEGSFVPLCFILEFNI